MQIPLPLRGLNDSLGFSKQPLATSSDLVNVRSVDPKTGRVRFSQRAGISAFARTREADAPVRWMGQITYDARKMTYAGTDTGSQEWVFTGQSAVESQFGCLDRQGNVYMIDGRASISKVNPSGELVWTLTPPVKDRAHVIRAVFVDQLDRVYVGISEGGDQRSGRMWCFAPDPKQAKGAVPKLAWEIELDAYVEQIVVRGDLVYTAQNQPDRFGAGVVVYRGALSSGPTLAWSAVAAYPLNRIAVKPNGDVVGCSPPFASRGMDPRYPLFTERTQDATLKDILGSEYDALLWRDNNAATLASTLNSFGNKIEDGDTGLRDRDSVLVWPDDSTADRDLFLSSFIASQTPPPYNARGIGGRPSVYFRGNRNAFSAAVAANIADALQSNGSQSASEAYADQHQGLIPGYFGAQWIMFIVLRPEEDRQVTPARQGVWGQPASIGGISNARQTLLVNRDDAGNATPGYGTFFDRGSSNGVGLGTQTDGGIPIPNHFQYGTGAGPDNQPITGNPNSTIILTIGCDGGMNAAVADGASTMHSFLRVNGKPIDRWETVAGGFTIDPGILGHSHNGTGIVHFRGDIGRIIVLHKLGVNGSINAGPATHPKYPHNIHDAATQPVGNVYSATTVFSATQVEKIEGMLAHEYGVSHLLPTGAASTPTYSAVAPFKTTNSHGNYPHPFYRRAGPPRATNVGRSEPYLLHSPNGIVSKWDGAKGDLQWVLTATSADNGGGLGYGVTVDPDGNVFSVGPKISAPGTFVDNYTADDTNLRKIQDLNAKGISGYSIAPTFGNVAWQTSLGTGGDDWSATRLHIATDDHGNLLVPVNYTALATPATLKVYQGDAFWNGTLNVGNEIVSYDDASHVQAYAVAVPPSPAYRFGASFDWDRNPTSDARTVRAEFAYVFVQQTTPTPNRDPGLIKVRLATTTPITGSPRSSIFVQVCAGNIVKFTAAGVSDFVGASTLAKPQLSATAEYIDGAIINSKLYLTDGFKIVVVDPVLDTVTVLKAADGSQIPIGMRLLSNWRGRLNGARAPDDPHNWHMAEQGKPRNWDRFSPPLLSTRAISGNNARAGLCPDIVNGIIPGSDNVLVYPCDHSIWAIVGDPADEGARAGMHQVSSITGGAFGRAWTQDPDGNTYLFGTRGGIYKLRGLNEPECLTTENIQARLEDIDQSIYRIELVWNTEDDGLHVFLIPLTELPATVHYFWNRTTDAWFSDVFAIPPASVFVADGDLPGDRALLWGTFDGYVHKWDRDAKSDVGEPIVVRALVGPLAPEETDFEWKFRDLEAVLARDQDGVQVRLYTSDVPDKKGAARGAVELTAGRNRPKPVGMTGCYSWIEITQSNPNRRFSIESLAWKQVTRGGRRQVAR